MVLFHAGKRCDPGYVCTKLFPLPGSRCVKKVTCASGLRVKDNTCEDIDECSEGKHSCTAEQYCINTLGKKGCHSIPSSMGFVMIHDRKARS